MPASSGYASLAVSAACIAFTACAWAARPESGGKPSIERGRYLARIAGCNDCHTPGYGPSAGQVPEKDWLVGDVLGFRGPWGTTYPTNLRTYMQEISEQQWLKAARTMEPRPPMPWFNLRAMSDPDLRALYRFVRSLGSAGKPAPAYVPPDKQPQPPFVQFP